MEKNMYFVIPEIPSKTFVMLKKKLPDHFKKPIVGARDPVQECLDPVLIHTLQNESGTRFIF